MRAAVAATLMFIAALTAATPASAERLTIAVSTPSVQITSNFSGATLTVFGVIEGGSDQVFLEGGYDAAVVVIGPPETVVARRQDRVFGIWVNSAAETFPAVPSFFAVDSSKPLTDIAGAATLSRLGIGFDQLPLPGTDAEGASTSPRPEFRDAFIRLKSQAGVYSETNNLQFLGDTIFRSSIALPANTPDGRYTVLAYLFTGQTLVAAADATFNVTKIGFEQTLASFAVGQPFIYGLLCVALAIFVGWLGGVIFRRD